MTEQQITITNLAAEISEMKKQVLEVVCGDETDLLSKQFKELCLQHSSLQFDISFKNDILKKSEAKSLEFYIIKLFRMKIKLLKLSMQSCFKLPWIMN